MDHDDDKAMELDLRRQAQIARQAQSIERLLDSPWHAAEIARLNDLLAWRDRQIGRILVAVSEDESKTCDRVREIAREKWPA